MTTEYDYPQIKRPVVPMSFGVELAAKVTQLNDRVIAPVSNLSLDNSALTFTPEYQEEQIMSFQRAFATRKTMRKCCLSVIQGREATINAWVSSSGEVRAGYTSLATCSSSLCPSCIKHLAKERRELIQNTLAYAENNGLFATFITLTTTKGGTLKDRIKDLNKCYSDTISKTLKQRLKRRGNKVFEYVRALDITINDKSNNPYHPHIHSLIITSDRYELMEDIIWDNWKSSMNKLGRKVSRLCYDFTCVDKVKGVESYLSKGLSFEVTSTNKESKGSNSLGFMKWVLSICDNPTKRQIAIYKNLLNETFKCRWFSKSKGFKGLGDRLEQEDKPLEVKEDKLVFSQPIGINLWYAASELKGCRAVLRHIIKDKVSGNLIDTSVFNSILLLLQGSRYENIVSSVLIEGYKLELIRIIKPYLSSL